MKKVLAHKDFFYPFLIFGIILTGATIRWVYFSELKIYMFQHDWQAHIEYIKYMAENWNLPFPSKGLEYPQQPLYYFLSASIYATSMYYGATEEQALLNIGYFALFFSFVFLYYGYRVIALLSDDRWVHAVATSFLSLTPSIIYFSARINNDILVAPLAAIALYYILLSYRHHFERYFYQALIAITLLFFTKLVAASMELLFFALMIFVYMKAPQEKEPAIKNRILVFGIVGMFALLYYLYRTHIPFEGGFRMINSADYPGQTIEEFTFSYFFDFNIKELIVAGQSYIFGDPAISYSFPTYQYGTMFFGEFNYEHPVSHAKLLKPVMQGILALGLIYVVGGFTYIVMLKESTLAEKALVVMLVLNLLLILKLLFQFPSICNTGFRYYAGAFPLIAFIFAKGLGYYRFNRVLSGVISTLVVMMGALEVVYFVELLKGLSSSV